MTPPPPDGRTDEAGRARILGALDETLFVEAAAGTGKTTVLVGRIVALCRTGRARLSGVVAVTFTDKAAGEMKLRLREEVERAHQHPATTPEERQRLELALAELEVARIETIHAFCADLLRERPVEAGVDPRFTVAREGRTERIFERAFDSWLERTVADPPEGVRRLLRREPKPSEELRAAARTLRERRDFEAPWQRPELDRGAEASRVVERLRTLVPRLEEAGDPDDLLVANLRAVAEWLADLDRRERHAGRDLDALEADLARLHRDGLWTRKGWARHWGGKAAHDRLLAERDAVASELARFERLCTADIAACLRQELRAVVDAYEEAKGREGCLDFVDLLLRARDLVRDDAGARADLQARWTHLLVDEFQDTDPLQAEILLLLSADDPTETDWRRARPVSGKLFVVGDPKQAIYAFRRAEVTLYERVKRRLVSHGAGVVELRQSFRAVRSLQSAVNAAFAPLMQGSADGSQAKYVALEPHRPDPPAHPPHNGLPAPAIHNNWGKFAWLAVTESYPEAVGGFVEWLLRESGWTVEEDGRPVPVAPRHVCLLSWRLRGDHPRPYAKALESRHIPHVLGGGGSFFERDEVLAIRNAVHAIEWPDDELSVFATLRGPWVALSDEELLVFRTTHGHLHPLRPGASEGAVQVALDQLRELHLQRNRRPVADTLSSFLGTTRAEAAVAFWSGGGQALAALERVLELARRFEADGATSFRAFVAHLEATAESPREEVGLPLEEGVDSVRIMTVHKAKGLEFPVVVLIDPAAGTWRGTPSYSDAPAGIWYGKLGTRIYAPLELDAVTPVAQAREDAEAVRLAYVAATRARDLLVVPVLDEGSRGEGWLSPLNDAVYPAMTGGPSIAPGAHAPRRGDHTAVWWDLRALRLTVDPEPARDLHELLRADGPGAAESLAAFERWRAAREVALEAGARPSFAHEAFTRLAHEGLLGALGPKVRVERVAGDRAGRPEGMRFGSLTHAVLAEVAWQPETADLEALATAHGRKLQCPEEEVAAAIVAVRAALAHPVMRRAARSPECRRESPVLLVLPDGTLGEGVVDLAFRDPDGEGWVIVDFKTDAELGERKRAYEDQVRLYIEAVQRATERPAEGLLLLV